MNENNYIGSPKWEQALSDIRELLGDPEISETGIRNLLAFDVPTLLTKVINTIDPKLTVYNCLPAWNNRVVIKFPIKIEKPETDNTVIMDTITSKLLQFAIFLNTFNPEVCYILNWEINSNDMLTFTLDKEVNE